MQRSQNTNRPWLRRGFTVLEILVSMVILSLLVVLLASMMGRISEAWMTGEGRSRANQSGRAIADVMRTELQGALLPIEVPIDDDDDDDAEEIEEIDNLQFVVNPSLPAEYQNRDSIFWQAPVATDKTFGDVAELGYFVAWDGLQPQLRRLYASLTQTSPSGEVTADPNFRIYKNPTDWITRDILEASSPADEPNDYRGLFAENVLGFWIRCLDPEGNPITQDADGTAFANGFDSRRGYRYRDGSGQMITKVGSALPAVIEISLALIDPRSAQRIDPALKAKIISVTAQAETASEFVEDAIADAGLEAIRPGLRAYTTTVFLRNSR